MSGASAARDLDARRRALNGILQDATPLLLEAYSPVPGADPARLARLGTEAKSSPKDLVTVYDKKVEEFLLGRMREAFPGEAIVGEESVAASGLSSREYTEKVLAKEGACWVVDPIDGTTNFSRAYPFFCSTAAFITRESGELRPTIGAVWDPVHAELFSAHAGGGAWLNGRRLRVTSFSDPIHCLLSTGFASKRSLTEERSFALFESLTKCTLGVRRDGSAAMDLAYVAAGRTDAYWEWSLSVWDTAAGILLVNEAGGQCSHLNGASIDPLSGEIVATNSFIHKWMLQELAAC